MKSLATAVAVGLFVLANAPAWGHTFAPLRTVVLQVEPCEVVMLVGYRAGTQDEADNLVARVAMAPKSHARDAMRDILASRAMAPLTLSVDGTPLVPTNVRAKLAREAGRPMVVLLVTFAWVDGKQLSLTSRDPRTTQISWTDRRSMRVVVDDAPAQAKFFSGVASFLLSLAPTSGGSARCSAPPTP